MPTQATTIQSNVTTITSACAKCGTSKKSGKLSCCAPAGSWFEKCGNPGNSNFDHTWDEGVQACRSFSRLFLNSAQQINAAQEQTMTSHDNNTYDVSNTNSRCDIDFTIVTFLSILSLITRI